MIYRITTLEDVDSIFTTQSSSTSIATSMVPTGILSPQGSQYLEKIQAIYPEYERLRKSTIAVSVLFAFSFIGTSFVTWARMVQRRDRLNATIHAGDDEEGDLNPATYLDGMAEEKDNDYIVYGFNIFLGASIQYSSCHLRKTLRKR